MNTSHVVINNVCTSQVHTVTHIKLRSLRYGNLHAINQSDLMKSA